MRLRKLPDFYFARAVFERIGSNLAQIIRANPIFRHNRSFTVTSLVGGIISPAEPIRSSFCHSHLVIRGMSAFRPLVWSSASRLHRAGNGPPDGVDHVRLQ